MKKTIQKILPYLNIGQLILVLTYFTGFLFVHGAYFAYTKTNLLFGDKYIQIIPLSNEIYFVNGLSCLFYLAFSLLIACVCWIIFRNLMDTGKIARRIVYRIRSKKVMVSILFSLALFFCNLLIIWLTIYLYNNYNLQLRIRNIDNLAFLLFVFPFFFLQIMISVRGSISDKSLIAERNDLEDIESLARKDSSKLFKFLIKSLFILLSMLHYITIIFCFGLISNISKVNNLMSQTGEFRFAEVETADDRTIRLISMDITKDYFIGYSSSDKSVVMIPKEQIRLIKTWNGSYESLPKGMKITSPEEIASTEDQVSYQLNRYYQFYEKSGNAEEFIKLLTSKYYEKMFSSIDPTILDQYWKTKEEKKRDFIDYEMSEVIEDVENDGYVVYVIEYWTNRTEHKIFHFEREDNDWKINEISTKTATFDLKLE